VVSQAATDAERSSRRGAKFQVFVSYRREDEPIRVDRLWADLCRGLGKKAVFKDVDALEPGSKFPEKIANAVRVADVFLAVIGPNWLSVQNEDGGRRLDDPGDYVGMEVEAALGRAAKYDDIEVVPVLVGGASMPGADDLPALLRDLHERHAVELIDKRWSHDVEQLVRWLKERRRRRRPPAWRRLTEAVAEGVRRLRSRRGAALAAAVVLVAAVVIAAVLILPDDAVWKRVQDDALTGRGSQVMNSMIDRQEVLEEGATGPRYVVGGRSSTAGDLDAAVWTSANGERWASEVLGRGLSGDQEIAALRRVGRGVLAIGSHDSGSGKDVAVWRSGDLRDWSGPTVQYPETGDETFYRLNAMGSLLLGSGWHTGDGDDAAVWKVDAAAGSVVPLPDDDLGGPGTQHMNRIVKANDGTLVGLGVDGDDAGVWLSEDEGQTWDRMEKNANLRGPGAQDIWDATVVAGTIVAVGLERAQDGTTRGMIWRTVDGETWTQGEPVDEESPVKLHRVFELPEAGPSDPTLAVAGKADGSAAVWTSRDGTDWHRDPDPGGDAADLRSMPVRDYPLVAVGFSGSEGEEDAAVWIREGP